MKKTLLLFTVTLMSFAIKAQSIIGAWESTTTSENGDQLKNVVIFADGYQVSTTYNAITGQFIRSNGGTWKLEDDMMTEKVEFDTANSERVGTENSFKVNVSDNSIEVVDSDSQLNRLDDGTPGQLKGAWLISGFIVDGKIQSRDTNTPRKTMKILSGTRFQWIAYNTETKEFMGTGGGTYTTINGEYTEHIEFFSKDDSRVGNSLKFNYNLIDGNWNHQGLSSKGDPLNEIWSVRNN